jgi:hypothetical protein
VNVVGRLFGSSTFLSAVLAIVASIACAHYGIPLDPLLAAALPVAVGVKEAGRRRADAQHATSDAMVELATRLAPRPLRAFEDEDDEDEDDLVENDPPRDLSQTSRFAADSIEHAKQRARLRDLQERTDD